MERLDLQPFVRFSNVIMNPSPSRRADEGLDANLEEKIDLSGRVWYDFIEQTGNGERHAMKSYLIKDTTREERERIVADSLGNLSGGCDGCAPGIVEMYQDYIDGRKELREVNMAFRAHFVSGDEGPERGGCGMTGK